MFKHSKTVTALAVTAAAALVLSGCVAEDAGGGSDPETQTLVIDRTFDLKTADPGRSYEFTGNMVVKGMYETLLDFEGEDLSRTVPGLATLEASDDSKTFTLKLDDGRTFSDGSDVTADDVVFSLDRVKGIKGSPSFLLDGINVSKVDATTVEITTDEPRPDLPFLLPNPSLAVLNSDVVKENGGTTDDTDDAESFLNSNSAGSGPYVLDSLDVASQVTFVLNDKYTGPANPTYGRVLLRNVEPATQKINLQGRDSQVALDLSGDQVEGLGDRIKVESSLSANLIFLLLNQDPDVSKVTSDPYFVEAVKRGIDFERLVQIAGAGSAQAKGFVPPMLLGSIDDGLTFDKEVAKKSLAKSSYDGEKVTLNFPNDINLSGVQFTTVAQSVQAQLSDLGINAELAPAPTAVELDTYRNGKETIGLWYWGPDYMDPSTYLPFGPGETIGLRAGWDKKDDPAIAKLVKAARVGGSEEDRVKQFTEYQKALLADGPFVPLLNPAVNLAAATGVTGLVYNPMWTIDIAGIGAE